jgi:hypothetical protein
MNWQRNTIALGDVRENAIREFKYISTEPLPIKDIKPGCGNCTFVKGYNSQSGELLVTYKSTSIPIHLRTNPGFHEVRKVITIVYQDDTSERLFFTAKVIKR